MSLPKKYSYSVYNVLGNDLARVFFFNEMYPPEITIQFDAILQESKRECLIIFDADFRRISDMYLK